MTVTILYFLICVMYVLSEFTLGQDIQSILVQQVLNTGPLWINSNNMDVTSEPEYVWHEFHQLQLQSNASLPNTISQQEQHTELLAVQGCLRKGNDSSGEISKAVLQFDITPTPANPSRLVSAELRLFVLNSSKPGTTHFTKDSSQMIQLYQIVEKQTLSQPDSHRLLSVQFLQATADIKGHWIFLNVKTAVTDWLTEVRPNLGFLLPNVEYSLSGPKQPLLIIKYGNKKQMSTLFQFEIEGWHNQSSVNFDEPLLATLCERQPWIVNFTLWGLLAPQELDIGLCSGICPFNPLHVRQAEHTAMLSIFGTPCCVSAQYRPSPIMYRQENGNFIIKLVSKLITKSCTCK